VHDRGKNGKPGDLILLSSPGQKLKKTLSGLPKTHSLFHAKAIFNTIIRKFQPHDNPFHMRLRANA